MEKPRSEPCRPVTPSAPDGGASISPAELLSRLDGAHSELLAICDRLEGIADSLPNTLNVRNCREAAGELVPVVMRAHRVEEEEVFLRIAGEARTAALQKTLDHLRTEHCEDECFAEELADALKQAGEGKVQPETLGYMLRGFFEAMRRHINFERERFLTLAGG
ncbi:MAG: hemerythrin domain-containing protein [Phyllobacteriaceae bacterium]|nr:hemerythrin domain-containing protein [Phyllobacteriaceae bacterium]